MSKATEFNWRPNLSNRLLKGELFDRWEDENGFIEENVIFRVDELGILFL